MRSISTETHVFVFFIWADLINIRNSVIKTFLVMFESIVGNQSNLSGRFGVP